MRFRAHASWDYKCMIKNFLTVPQAKKGKYRRKIGVSPFYDTKEGSCRSWPRAKSSAGVTSSRVGSQPLGRICHFSHLGGVGHPPTRAPHFKKPGVGNQAPAHRLARSGIPCLPLPPSPTSSLRRLKGSMGGVGKGDK